MKELLKHHQRSLRHKRFVWSRKLQCWIAAQLSNKRKRLIRIAWVVFLLAATQLVILYVFPIQKITAGWYNDTWKFRRLITIDESKVAGSSNFTNFPVLVSFTDTALTALSQSDGDDLLFTSDNGTTKLDHEIETFNAATGQVVVWVEVPTLKATTNTIIYLYYGNSTASSQQNGTGVWDSNYKIIHHLAETGSPYQDATSNNKDGSEGTVPPTATTGKISGGQDFDGTDDKYEIASPALPTGDFTYEVWFRPDTTGVEQDLIGMANGTLNDEFELGINSGNTVSTELDDVVRATSTATVSTGNWYHLVVTRSGSAITQYINASSDGTGTYGTALNFGSCQAIIGNDAANNCAADTAADANGAFDEVRISDTPRSADWITTEYNNQSAPLGFLSLTEQEEKDAPVLYWKFDEGYGTTANDSSVDDNDGTYKASGEPAIQAEDMCVYGKCVKFDGSNDYVRKTYSADTELDVGTASFSVGAWFKHPTSISGTDTIISRADGVNGIGYKLYYDATNGVCFGIDAVAGTFPSDSACTTTSHADNKWHYIIGVKSGTSSITLYIDGNQVAQDASITGSTISGTNSAFYVGLDADGTSNPWDGYVDEVKFYDYARSATQIKADYISKGSVMGAAATFGAGEQSTSLSQGLVGYWKMDESAANSCTGGTNDSCDSSGNVLDGAWNGNATTTASGKFSNGTTYDGSGDYTNITDNAVFDLSASGNYTWSFWVNPTSFAVNFKNVWAQENTSTGDYFDIYAHTESSDTNWDVTQGIAIGWLTSGGSLFIQSNNTVLSTSTWSHVVVTYDGSKAASNRFTIYVNGIDQTDRSDVTTSGTIGNISPNSIRIGQTNGLAAESFNGKIDEGRFYMRTLSSPEASSLYDWAPGPVGHWKMDEGSGTTLNDSSGNGYTSTTTSGTPTWNSGRFGQAMHYDGTNSVVRIDPAVSSVLDGIGAVGQSYTVSAWIRTKTNFSNEAFVVAKNAWSTNEYPFQLYVDATELPCFEADDSGAPLPTICGGTTVNDGKWHNLTGIRDDITDKLYLYVDGTLVASAADSNTGSTANADDISIGNGATSYTLRDFTGDIDDVRIYNYTRTSKQIVSDMNAGHPNVGSPVASSVGYWKFDEGSGTTANNAGSAGSAANGTLTNMATGSTASGWTNAGRLGKAVSFDGTNDYVSMGNPTAAQITSNLSLSAWVRLSATSSNQDIIAKRGAGGQWGYRLWVDSTGTPKFDLSDDGSRMATVSASTTLSPNTWYHLAGTFATGSAMTIFINGSQKGQVTSSLPSSVKNSTANLNLGGENAGASNLLNGTIDEAKLYNYALSVDEIKLEYNQGKSQTLGSLSINADGVTASNSAGRAYCPPGNAEGNCAAGSDASPVGEWLFDENTGTTANDTSGKGNNLTLNSSDASVPTWRSGKNASAVVFDGSTDYANKTSMSTDLVITGNLSISAWVYARSTSTDDEIVNGTGTGGVSPGANQMYSFQLNTGGFPKMFWEFGATPTSQNATSTVALTSPVNRWVHVTAVRDVSANTVTFYENGKLLDTVSYTNDPDGGTTTPRLTIGANALPGGRAFDGAIDQVRIYNYTRTPAQVAWDYNKSKPVGWWKFDECSGTTANDASGFGNSGTITPGAGTNTTAGTCNSNNAAHMWDDGNFGKFGTALGFDGSDDYVVTGNTAPIAATGETFTNLSWGGWLVASTSAASKTIIHKNSEFRLTTDASSKAVCTLYYSAAFQTGTQATSATTIPTGTWTNVMCTYDGANVKVYVNGKLDATSSAVSNAITSTNTTAVSIGRDPAPSGYFEGLLDDIRLYNFTLTAPQLLQLYNEGSAVRFGPATGSP